LDLVYACVGLVILVFAGEVLVRGAVNLALRLGIPALIVSLTIVSFGTSAPELFISVDAVLMDAPGIAIGNVLGSNTANVLLVLGVPALIAGISCQDTATQRSLMMMLGVTGLFIVTCFLGPLTWVHGVILLAVLAVILWDQGREALAHKGAAEEAPEGADPSLPGWRIALYLVLGLIGLPLGANLLVDSAVNIATAFGVSETVIGLTLVAVGTSLPELATTVVAVMKRESEVALGNVIGSNIFNLLAIIGAASLFGTIPVTSEVLQFEIWVMAAASLALVPFVMMRRNITRAIGGVLTAVYVAYVIVLLM